MDQKRKRFSTEERPNGNTARGPHPVAANVTVSNVDSCNKPKYNVISESELRTTNTQVGRNTPRHHHWQTRDQLYIHNLSICVRCFSLSQLADSYFNGSVSAAKKRLVITEKAGLIERYPAIIHPPLSVDRPVVSWKLDHLIPVDLESISHKLRSRWTTKSLRTSVYIASPKAAVMFGRDYHPLPRASELNHDLHLSEIFLWYRKNRPQLAQNWVGEDAIKQVLPKPSNGQAIPDALILDSHFNPVQGVEAGGQYSPRRIAKLFAHIKQQRYQTFEIW